MACGVEKTRLALALSLFLLEGEWNSSQGWQKDGSREHSGCFFQPQVPDSFHKPPRTNIVSVLVRVYIGVIKSQGQKHKIPGAPWPLAAHTSQFLSGFSQTKG